MWIRLSTSFGLGSAWCGGIFARWPEEVSRIFRMLDFYCAEGHDPFHLLLISAAEIGFARDGAERGWIRVALPPLSWRLGRVFGGAQFLDIPGSSQLLTFSLLREKDNMLVRYILCGGEFEMVFFWGRPELLSFSW